MIYFMQPVDGGPVKIGSSDDVEARRRVLEGHYGRPLVVLGTMSGGKPEEMDLHRRFAHLRLGRTEQFRPGADLMEFIGRPLLVGANPGAVETMEPANKPNGLVIRGSVEWRDWLKRAAEFERTTVAELIDRAAASYARLIGFKEAPPKR
jgi:hypothetical protein